jgi:hypothetical protein
VLRFAGRRRSRRLEERARREGTSVAAVIRRAIDSELADDPHDRAQAVRDLLDMTPAPVDDWPALEREIEAGYERDAGGCSGKRRRG